MAFAGLWETWTGPNGEEMETAAIVTTQANTEMAAVHHRAPVIVPPEQFDFWLDCGNVDEHDARRRCSSRRPTARWRSTRFRRRSTRSPMTRPTSLEALHSVAGGGIAASGQTARQKRAADSGQGSLF